MLIAVIGAGAAGLTAAHRLQQAGHQVAVFEARPFVGGRTHTESFGPGHHLDTGAGWLTSAYTRTLALLDELGMRERMHPLRASAPAELRVDGQSFSGAGRPRVAEEASPLVSPGEQEALQTWLRDLRQYPQDLSARLEHDDESAEEHLAPVSPQASRYIFGPLFEGLFVPLAEQSAEFLRSWVASGRATYWQLDDGMDAPWKAVAARLDVRLDEPVVSVRRAIGGLEVVSQRTSGLFDGVVVAAPPPVAVHAIEPALTPGWYRAVRYSGQCRLYVSRRGDGPPEPVHLRPLPMGLIASVEWQSGSLGAWGACPPGTEWVLICANQQHNDELLGLPPAVLTARLWHEAGQLVPGLPSLDEAAVTHLVRWEEAVPVMPPGHFTSMAAYRREPPLVFAGDWTHQACVEGAVRSGEAAAAAFGKPDSRTA